MKYIKILTACLAFNCLLYTSNIATATVKEDIAENNSNKIAIKKMSENTSKKKITSWPKGGLNIITDKNGKAKDIILKDNDLADKKYKIEAKNKDKIISSEQKKVKGRKTFANIELPENYENISIYGDAVADKSQAIALIKANNPQVRLACSIEELVDLYWEEASRENVRPDLALAQSLVETGYYRYGGDVKHHQNNFCGLGTTGGGVKGAAFKTPQIGVRAHIQHLLAYTQKQRPKTSIVDPRYELAHKIRVERGVVDTWCGLNGTWAMGSSYCEKIMATYQKMLGQPITKLEKVDKKQDKKKKKEKKRSMRERVEELLKERNR